MTRIELPSTAAATFRMTDEVWRRHANPWSVWSRFAAIPAMILAIWSRVWIEWWALAPVALVTLWLWLNPRVFRPVAGPTHWTAKGIYGEKLWLTKPSAVPGDFRTVLRWLISLGVAGFALVAWGVALLQVWPTVLGAVLIVVAQLWRIDRMGLLYADYERSRSARNGEVG